MYLNVIFTWCFASQCLLRAVYWTFHCSPKRAMSVAITLCFASQGLPEQPLYCRNTRKKRKSIKLINFMLSFLAFFVGNLQGNGVKRKVGHVKKIYFFKNVTLCLKIFPVNLRKKCPNGKRKVDQLYLCVFSLCFYK